MIRKKILVIGGNGFIGKNLLKMLVKEANMEVYCFDLQLPFDKISNVQYIEGDFFDEYVLGEAVKGKDIIIHALSTVNPGNSNVKYMQGYSRDFIQTIKLCEMIASQNSEMLFLSSGGTVYGIQGEQPIKETALPIPINHYGNIKLCIENVLRTFNRQRNTRIKIVRISNPYGPGQDYRKGVGFIDAALKNAICGGTLEIWGNGEIVRDYIYIEDVCKMLLSLLAYEGCEEVFNISTSIGVSQNQIIKVLHRYGKEVKTNYKERRNVDVDKIILCNEKIRSIYAGNIISIEEGIGKYLNYLTRQNYI